MWHCIIVENMNHSDETTVTINLLLVYTLTTTTDTSCNDTQTPQWIMVRQHSWNSMNAIYGSEKDCTLTLQTLTAGPSCDNVLGRSAESSPPRSPNVLCYGIRNNTFARGPRPLHYQGRSLPTLLQRSTLTKAAASELQHWSGNLLVADPFAERKLIFRKTPPSREVERGM